VPLVSRGVIVLLTFFAALPFSVIIYSQLGLTIVGVNFLIFLLFSLLVGILVHILYLLLLKLRFNNPSPDMEFHNLVSRIHQKVVVSSNTHLWVRQSNDIFIASTFNPIYNAIIISEPMMELIMQSPESGEALVAFHLLRVPRIRWFGELVGSVILFILFTFISSIALIPFAIAVVQMLMVNFVMILYSLVSFASLSMVPIIFIFVVKGTFWRHEPAFVGVQDIYGIHPNVAKVQVEKGVILDEDEAQTVVWAIREWEKSKRDSRRIGISTFAAIPAYFLGYALMLLIAYSSPTMILITVNFIPLFLAGGVWGLCYVLLRRWDRNAMGDVFKKTTDYDEPIWVD
jgi:hypothetical protein